jgi:hypothetical protein
MHGEAHAARPQLRGALTQVNSIVAKAPALSERACSMLLSAPTNRHAEENPMGELENLHTVEASHGMRFPFCQQVSGSSLKEISQCCREAVGNI